MPRSKFLFSKLASVLSYTQAGFSSCRRAGFSSCRRAGETQAIQSRSEAIGLMLGLIGVSIAGRLLLEQPNFKPGMAAAILAGVLLKDWRLALLVPIVSMSVTDLFLGTYAWPVMISVYLAMSLPVFWSRIAPGLQAYFFPALRPKPGSAPAWMLQWFSWNCGAIGAAVLFLVLTSCAVWAGTPWYPKTFSGLCQAHWSAIPFMRWMITGNLFFLNAMVLTGSVVGIFSQRSRLSRSEC